MKHSAIRVIPYGGYDIPGLESWLSSMAGNGLRLASTAGPLALFDHVQPQKVQIHLEPIQGSTEENPELNAIYEKSGWQYWGIFQGSFFIYASPDMEAQAYTDPDSLDYALKKFFRQKLAVGLPLLLGNFLLPGLYGQGAPWELSGTLLRYYPVETLSNGTTIPFLLAVLGFCLIDLSYLVGLFHLMSYRRAVKNGRKVRGHWGIGWLLAAGLLVLLPVLVNTIQLFSGTDYRPYDLDGSGFVTLSTSRERTFPSAGGNLSVWTILPTAAPCCVPKPGISGNMALLGQIKVQTTCLIWRFPSPATPWRYWPGCGPRSGAGSPLTAQGTMKPWKPHTDWTKFFMPHGRREHILTS